MSSTFLCIAHENLPGVQPCRVRGLHRVSCPDHPGFTSNPGLCDGCLPRLADIGLLCAAHYERVQAAHIAWGPWRRVVVAMEGRTVSPDNGGIKGSTPTGYSNLPLTVLALDECDRLLASLKGFTLDAWVHTEAGARDAVMFAHAAESAYRSLEVEAKPKRLERARCPHCGLLSLTGNPARYRSGVTEVVCRHCGGLLDTVRDDTPTWVGSVACESGVHGACRDLNCRCECHVRRVSLYTVQVPAHLLRKEAS